MSDFQPENYDNLIDKMLALNEDDEVKGNAGLMFKLLLKDYFFASESDDSKKFEAFLTDFESPDFLKNEESLFDIDIDELKNYMEGEVVSFSLAGKIMLSKIYLKAFYSNHPPDFNSMPEEVKSEVLEKVNEKNDKIISAFEKMKSDRTGDEKRKILTLVAHILKTVHYKTERPFNKLTRTAKEIIKSIYSNTDDIFTGDQVQIADLQDDMKIKDLLKVFFKINQFDEINEMKQIYDQELEIYKKRSALAFNK